MSRLPKFDGFIALDWSGAAGRYDGIAVAMCRAGRSAPALIEPRGKRWSRAEIAEWLELQLKRGRRFLIGMDFAFGFPFESNFGYLGGWARGVEDIFALWSWIELRSCDEPDFGCHTFLSDPHCRDLFWVTGRKPKLWIERKRRTELRCGETTGTHPDSLYKLLGPRQVGKASLTGMRILHRIRSAVGDCVAMWPFETARASVIVEIYPTLFRKIAAPTIAKLRSQSVLNEALARIASDPMPNAVGRDLSDHQTDALISAAGLRWLARKPEVWTPTELASSVVQREGWIFGVAR